MAHAPDDRLARGEPVNTGWRPDWRRYRQSIRGPTATTCVRGAAVGAGLDEARRPPAHATHHGSSTSLTLPSPIVSYRIGLSVRHGPCLSSYLGSSSASSARVRGRVADRRGFPCSASLCLPALTDVPTCVAGPFCGLCAFLLAVKKAGRVAAQRRSVQCTVHSRVQLLPAGLYVRY